MTNTMFLILLDKFRIAQVQLQQLLIKFKVIQMIIIILTDHLQIVEQQLYKDQELQVQ